MPPSPSSRPGPRITAAMLRDIGLFGGMDDETLSVLAKELPTIHVEGEDSGVKGMRACRSGSE